VVSWKLRNNNLDIKISSYDCAPIINQSGLPGIWRGKDIAMLDPVMIEERYESSLPRATK